MDVDLWSARVNSANNFSSVRSTHLGNSDSHLNEDNEAEDVRAWFPCPFCNVEIEVPTLCSHLQDEHCFDLKNAVCLICAATLGRDPVVHFSVQHAQSVKRKKNHLKPGFWNNATAMIGKDLQEITSIFGANSAFGQYKGQELAPDPLLLPFLCNIPPSDPKCRQQASWLYLMQHWKRILKKKGRELHSFKSWLLQLSSRKSTNFWMPKDSFP